MPRSAGTGSSKGEILRTFANLVATYGYDQTSFREVAEALDISKGTIVHHYGTKERLLEAVHREYMERRTWEAHEILGSIKGPSAQLTALIAQLLITQQDDRDATVSFAREIMRFSQMDLMHDVRAMRREYTTLVRSVIQQGMDAGEFRAGDAELVSLQIFGMCNWAWTWWRPDQRWAVEDVIATWSNTILAGIKTRTKSGPVDVSEIVKVVSAKVAATGNDGVPNGSASARTYS